MEAFSYEEKYLSLTTIYKNTFEPKGIKENVSWSDGTKVELFGP